MSYIRRTGVTNGAETIYLFGASEFTHGFKWGLCCSIVGCLCFVDHSSFRLFSYEHCIVCFSNTPLVFIFEYSFGLYLRILLWFVSSNTPLVFIFKLFVFRQHVFDVLWAMFLLYFCGQLKDTYQI